MTFDPRRPFDSTDLYESGGLYDGWDYKGDNPGPWLIELGVDLFANGIGDWFTLDDPVKGELDNTSFLLAGEVLVDITRYARRMSIKRGRSRLLEKFITGQCEVRLDNRDRIFDPLITGGPFTGQIIPRKQLKISWNNEPVFTGNVADWDFEYDPKAKDAVAVVKALDGFQYLATRNVPAQTMTVQKTGERVEYVLDQVGWPDAARDVDAGTASVAGDVVGDNVNALSYLQKIEVSDNGLLFIRKDGLLRFEDSFQGVYTPIEFGGEFGVPYTDIEVLYGSEELYNRVNISYFSGSVSQTVTVEDFDSQALYGTFEQSYDTLLSASADAIVLGQLLVNRFKEPKYRIEQVTFDARAVNSGDREYLMSLELGDRVRLQFRPLDVGEVIDRTVLVDGIEHDVAAKTHIVRMALTDLGYGGGGPIVNGGFISEYKADGKLYRLHSFTDAGTYDLDVKIPIETEVLIVGAGGGVTAASPTTGGGGAGGVLYGPLTFTSASTYQVIVGAHNVGASGQSSQVASYVALGGGLGGAGGSAGGSGGSGGGGGSASPSFGAGGTSTQISYGSLIGYGNSGASAYDDGKGTAFSGGGGGAGGNAFGDTGGAPFSASITGAAASYAAGGDGLPEGVITTSTNVLPNRGDGQSADPMIVYTGPLDGVVFIRYEV